MESSCKSQTSVGSGDPIMTILQSPTAAEPKAMGQTMPGISFINQACATLNRKNMPTVNGLQRGIKSRNGIYFLL